MLLEHLRVSGLLSFGPAGLNLPLRGLNVLIGPNGSGKSNLLEVLALLQAAPVHLASPVTDTDGIQDWLWKSPGGSAVNCLRAATVAVTVSSPTGHRNDDVHHSLTIEKSAGQFRLTGESIVIGYDDPKDAEVYAYPAYRLENGTATSLVRMSKWNDGSSCKTRTLAAEKLHPEMSILSQLKSPFEEEADYPAYRSLSTRYARIRLYREIPFGPGSKVRELPRADDRSDYLSEDFRNLALVLGSERFLPVKRRLGDEMGRFYEEFEAYHLVPTGVRMQLFMEEGGRQIPLGRLSDGTLRYFCLLAILLDPEPPPLVAIEEPELGLHPDVIPRLAELLVEASERMQLVVTTHSRLLVDALSGVPESIVVCSKVDGETKMERLKADDLREWLEHYSLGELWSKGEIGGNRW